MIKIKSIINSFNQGLKMNLKLNFEVELEVNELNDDQSVIHSDSG